MGASTWSDLHRAPVGAALSFTVSHRQQEAVLPLHQVSQEQRRLVVRVVQHVLKQRAMKVQRHMEAQCLFLKVEHDALKLSVKEKLQLFSLIS